MLRILIQLLPLLLVVGLTLLAVRTYMRKDRLPARAVPARPQERTQMSRKSSSRLPFFLLMGLTLYAAFMGAG